MGENSGSNVSNQEAEEKTDFAVGDVISYEGREVTVVSVERNYNSNNEFYQPESGKEFVKVSIKIENKSKNILGYEYNENIGKNNGLLIDYFVVEKKLDNNYYKILNTYKNVFLKTIKFVNCFNYKIFFDNRVNTRMKYNYEFIFNLLKKRNFML